MVNHKNLIHFLKVINEWRYENEHGFNFIKCLICDKDNASKVNILCIIWVEVSLLLDMTIYSKYTLNFAVTSKCNLDVDLMNKYFNKDKCIVKITPIHETVEAVNEGYEIVKDFDVYEKFEQPLVKDGWDVIVFVPSKEEDADRITCGNSLIAIADKARK